MISLARADLINRGVAHVLHVSFIAWWYLSGLEGSLLWPMNVSIVEVDLYTGCNICLIILTWRFFVSVNLIDWCDVDVAIRFYIL